MKFPLVTEVSFNYTIFQQNEANRWKFLEEINQSTGNGEVGLLMESPVVVMTLTSLYILYVCFIGPLLMRNRQPFQLKTVIRFYNLLMVLLAGYLLARIYDAIDSLDSMVTCSKIFSFSDKSATKIYQMANLILTVRMSEYLDTIFFILRKKDNQVTFLHVFHHAFVPMYAFWILRTAPLRFNVFIILINSFIHVLMYSYYYLATFQQPRADGANSNKKPAKMGILMQVVTKLLMFKKYMTQLQILQFVFLALYAIWASLQTNRCGIPWTYIVSNLLLAFGFLGLFLHFYIRVYKSALQGRTRTKRD